VPAPVVASFAVPAVGDCHPAVCYSVAFAGRLAFHA
jgi:hypothetical protein